MSLWTPTLVVLSSVLAILVLMAAVSIRLGMRRRPSKAEPPAVRPPFADHHVGSGVERQEEEPLVAGRA